MASQFFNTVFYGGVAGLATILGMLLIVWKAKWAKRNALYFISFGAGAMISVALIHLIPEALELNSQAVLFVLLSFVGFYWIEQFLCLHPHHHEDEKSHSKSSFGRIKDVAYVGLLIHSLFDGVVIGVGFEVSPELGLLATIGVILHEVPEGITSMAIFLHAKMKQKEAIVRSLAVALATPIAAVLTYFFIQTISESVIGMLLGLAAGGFVYVAASDLLPETHKNASLKNAAIMLSGVILIYAISTLFG